MNLRKFTLSQCGHVLKHFSREVEAGHYSNENIDHERTFLNRNYGPEREGISQYDYLKKMLEDIPHVKRKDLVVMSSIIVNAPEDLGREYYDKFFQLTYDFLVDRYGSKSGLSDKEDIVVSCYRHDDEETSHIHFCSLPIFEDEKSQRFNSRSMYDREDLKTLHKDLEGYLMEHHLRCSILNGNTVRDSTGRALSIRELKIQRERERKLNIKRGRF